MADAVIDASAVLACLRNESGGDAVAGRLGQCILSSANAAEVVSKLIAKGATAEEAVRAVRLLPCPIVAVDGALGLRAGALYQQTSTLGLSLGDRICLALAEREGIPALTADRVWTQASLAIEIQLIR